MATFLSFVNKKTEGPFFSADKTLQSQYNILRRLIYYKQSWSLTLIKDSFKESIVAAENGFVI